MIAMISIKGVSEQYNKKQVQNAVKLSRTQKIYIYTCMALCLFLFYILMSMILGTFSGINRIPKVSELSEVNGILDHYYIFKTHMRKGSGYNYTPIIVLKNGSHYWTSAVNKDSASKIFDNNDMAVRVYINLLSTAKPIDGAVKSYGLWVNGHQLCSPDTVLNYEMKGNYVTLAIEMAVTFCFSALFLWVIVAGWKAIRNSSEHELD
jgi:hypothetical protein